MNCEIRSLQLSSDNKNLLVGTYGSEIWELLTKDAKITTSTKFTNPKNLMRGHYTPNKRTSNEVWGLATMSNENDLFATCSDDCTLRLWSITHKKMVKQIKTNLDASGS